MFGQTSYKIGRGMCNKISMTQQENNKLSFRGKLLWRAAIYSSCWLKKQQLDCPRIFPWVCYIRWGISTRASLLGDKNTRCRNLIFFILLSLHLLDSTPGGFLLRLCVFSPTRFLNLLAKFWLPVPLSCCLTPSCCIRKIICRLEKNLVG